MASGQGPVLKRRRIAGDVASVRTSPDDDVEELDMAWPELDDWSRMGRFGRFYENEK
jgi:hypothetical protein